MSDELRLQLLFSKYLNRSCTAQELQEMLLLLQKADADNTLDDHFREVWDTAKKDAAEDNVDWDKMFTSISHSDEDRISLHHYRKKWLYPAAAVLAVILFLGAYWAMSRRTVAPSEQAGRETGTEAIKRPASARQTIHLPDGSSVVLNAGSKLNYPSVFTRGRRDVYLQGEGFFDIKSDPKNPFFVHIGQVAVRVLGTAFNIRTEPGGQQVDITVTRGKVQVMNEDRNIAILRASEQLSFNTRTAKAVTQVVDTLPVLAWKPAEIYFNDLTMEEAARRLELIYGISVSFDNPLAKNCRVTTTFSEDDLVQEILTVICAVSKTDFSINNNKIIIHGKGCD